MTWVVLQCMRQWCLDSMRGLWAHEPHAVTALSPKFIDKNMEVLSTHSWHSHRAIVMPRTACLQFAFACLAVVAICYRSIVARLPADLIWGSWGQLLGVCSHFLMVWCPLFASLRVAIIVAMGVAKYLNASLFFRPVVVLGPLWWDCFGKAAANKRIFFRNDRYGKKNTDKKLTW